MKLAILLPLAALPSLSLAQVPLGDLLISRSTATGEVQHLDRMATVLQTFAPSTSSAFSAVDVLPDGNWVVLRRLPAVGFLIYDPVAAAILFEYDIPTTVFPSPIPLDIAARTDGTILVVDAGDGITSSSVARFAQDGRLLEQWFFQSTQQNGEQTTRIAVDDANGMWIALADPCCTFLQYRDAAGVLVTEIPTVWPIEGLSLAQDGTLWTVEGDTWVQSYPEHGHGYGYGAATDVAADADGTLWFEEQGGNLTHRTTGGALLGSFAMPDTSSMRSIRRVNLGANYCTANPNSTGVAAEMVVFGRPEVSQADLHFLAQGLPTHEFGYFLNSPVQGFVANPGGSAGNLCLGGVIGRHIASIANTGEAGTIHTLVDATALPRPGGAVAIQPGETWNFQGWFRDGTTSNFTDGASVTFE